MSNEEEDYFVNVEVSQGNFEVFKDQIKLNQHSPLYNDKIQERQKVTKT
jgi:hypothetical protein